MLNIKCRIGKNHLNNGRVTYQITRIAEVRINPGTAFPGDITDDVVYILEDQIGSSVVRLNTSGTIIDEEEYYPFGDSSLRTFTYKRYRYVGKERDAESGLYYYGARYYSAWNCRFISVDPLAGKFAQLSPFNYSENNPINDKDIDGMQKGNSKPSTQGRSSGADSGGGSAPSGTSFINIGVGKKIDVNKLSVVTTLEKKEELKSETNTRYQINSLTYNSKNETYTINETTTVTTTSITKVVKGEAVENTTNIRTTTINSETTVNSKGEVVSKQNNVNINSTTMVQEFNNNNMFGKFISTSSKSSSHKDNSIIGPLATAFVYHKHQLICVI